MGTGHRIAALLFAGACLGAGAPAWSATLTVCASGCDQATLAGAIAAATPGDTLALAAETFAGPVTIDRDLVIEGQGDAQTIIDAQAGGTAVTVPSGVTAALVDLQVTGGLVDGNGGGVSNAGNLTLTRAWVTGNTASDGGGGVFNSGTLLVGASMVTHNTGMTDGTGNIGGGGIASLGGSANVTITNSAIVSNALDNPGTEDRGGGGIASKLGQLVIRGSDVSDNSSGYAAGGIYAAGSGGSVSIGTTTVTGNQTGTWPSRATGKGGGLFLDNSVQATITTSTIANNTALASGGGIYADVVLTLENATVFGNLGDGVGGGIFAEANMIADSVTVAGNAADFGGGVFVSGGRTLFATNLIIANNTATDSGTDCYGTVDVTTGNTVLIETVDANCVLQGGGQALINQDPLLGALAMNGGASPTMLPAAGSPAIDAGATTLTADQRGVPRPQGGAADLGAVEVAVLTPLQLSLQESVLVTDFIGVLPPLRLSLQELVLIDDQVQGSGPRRLSVAEFVMVADSVAVIGPLKLSVVESVVVTDAITPIPAEITIEVSEQIGINDHVLAFGAITIEVDESIGVSDSTSTLGAVLVTVNEVIGVGDSMTAETTGTQPIDILAPGGLHPDSELIIRAGGFRPFTLVQAFLESTPVLVGEAMADATGNVTIVANIPADFPPGAHTLVLVGTAPDGSPRRLQQPVTVATGPAGVPGQPGNSTAHPIPVAGLDHWSGWLLVLLMLTLGAWAFLVGGVERGGRATAWPPCFQRGKRATSISAKRP